jgi:hypothetical protein
VSDNADSLDIIRQEAGEAAFERICARLCGERVLFPHRRRAALGPRIEQYLGTGYNAKQIAEHLRCSVRLVYYYAKRAA